MSRRKLIIDSEIGEVICPKCNGSSYSKSYPRYCWNCNNQGKIFWIDRIIPKKHPFETLTIPIIRNVFPRLLAEDIVSFSPLEKK